MHTWNVVHIDFSAHARGGEAPLARTDTVKYQVAGTLAVISSHATEIHPDYKKDTSALYDGKSFFRILLESRSVIIRSVDIDDISKDSQLEVSTRDRSQSVIIPVGYFIHMLEEDPESVGDIWSYLDQKLSDGWIKIGLDEMYFPIRKIEMTDALLSEYFPEKTLAWKGTSHYSICDAFVQEHVSLWSVNWQIFNPGITVLDIMIYVVYEIGMDYGSIEWVNLEILSRGPKKKNFQQLIPASRVQSTIHSWLWRLDQKYTHMDFFDACRDYLNAYVYPSYHPEAEDFDVEEDL